MFVLGVVSFYHVLLNVRIRMLPFCLLANTYLIDAEVGGLYPPIYPTRVSVKWYPVYGNYTVRMVTCKLPGERSLVS